MNRQVQSCPHRFRLEHCTDDKPSHYCQLLQTLSGVEASQWCRVSEQLCQNCTRFTTPEADRLNPVIASRLYQLSATILGEGGVKGCDPLHAKTLIRKAEREVDTETAVRDRRSDSRRRGRFGFLSTVARRGRGRRIANWSVGITTAPRPTQR